MLLGSGTDTVFSIDCDTWSQRLAGDGIVQSCEHAKWSGRGKNNRFTAKGSEVKVGEIKRADSSDIATESALDGREIRGIGRDGNIAERNSPRR